MPQIQVESLTFNDRGYANLSGVVRWAGITIKGDAPNQKAVAALTLEVEGGPLNGQHAYANCYMTPAAWPVTLKQMKEALGYKGETREGLYDFLPKQVGEPIKWSMKAEEWEGKTRAKVSGLYASGERQASRDDYLRFCASQGEDVKIPEPAAQAAEAEDDPNSGLPF